MQTKLVNVRLPIVLYDKIKDSMQEEGYASVQEFIKEATRSYYQMRALKSLHEGYGSLKSERILSKEERANLLLSLSKKDLIKSIS